MNWKIYAQNPEHHDDQGIIILHETEELEDDDFEEFMAINDPGESGIIIRDLASARQWAKEIYRLRGDVVTLEIL
jgi:hypothetical protein